MGLVFLTLQRSIKGSNALCPENRSSCADTLVILRTPKGLSNSPTSASKCMEIGLKVTIQWGVSGRLKDLQELVKQEKQVNPKQPAATIIDPP